LKAIFSIPVVQINLDILARSDSGQHYTTNSGNVNTPALEDSVASGVADFGMCC
jgi:hypothetical protein